MSDERATGNGLDRRLRDLELWRVRVEVELDTSRRTREKYIPIVEELVSEDKIAQRIHEAVRATDRRAWTRKERALAWVFAATTVGSFVLQILGRWPS